MKKVFKEILEHLKEAKRLRELRQHQDEIVERWVLSHKKDDNSNQTQEK